MEQTLLSGRYLLLRRIGIGGMAYVYEAEDTLLRRKVAVKVLKQQFLEDEEFVQKFENEAQSAASLEHPNVVNIYDVGQHEANGQVQHYIVMELVNGTTLKEHIDEKGPLNDSDIARFSTQIATALSVAHHHNIIHRDIKPANILLTADDQVKVTDFGIARISTTATITYTNSILGTIHYISPEQAKGRFIDQKSDLYSLGVVMYEMATGEVPFDAENSVGIAIKHIQEDPVPPIKLNPNLHPGLNEIIMKCLEKESVDRYFSADELINDLRDYKNFSDTVFIPGSAAAGMAVGAGTAGAGSFLSSDTERMPKKAVAKEVTYQSKNYQDDTEDQNKDDRLKWFLLLTTLALAVGALLIMFFGNQGDNGPAVGTVTVPPLTNIQEEQAIQLLEDRNLTGSVTDYSFDDTVPEGYVISQSIPNGTTVEEGTEIGIVVSQGKETFPVPNVTNKSSTDADAEMRASGFNIARVEYENSDNIEQGFVIRTDPAAGTYIPVGSEVILYVSQGRLITTTTVPVLTNLEQAKAINAVNEANLTIGSIYTENSQYESGLVIRQSIEPGQEVERKTVIDITVSLGPAEESSSQSEETTEMVEYIQRVEVPSGKDSFRFTIYDLNISSDTPIYDETLYASQADASGIITLRTVGSVGANFYYEIDGQPADSWMDGDQPSEGSEEVPEESSIEDPVSSEDPASSEEPPADSGGQ